MASKIATQSDAYSKGGKKPSGYVAAKCCTNAMAKSCGCADPGYASNRLVPESLLSASGKTVTYKLYGDSSEVFYDYGCTFTDLNGNRQTLTMNTKSLKITVPTQTKVASPLTSTAWYKMYQYDTQNVATVNWSVNTASNLIEGILSSDGSGGGGVVPPPHPGGGGGDFDNFVTITVVANNPNFGSVIGGGEYPYGTMVTLHAVPNRGYRFDRWDVGGSWIMDEENPVTFTVTASGTYTAIFVLED